MSLGAFAKPWSVYCTKNGQGFDFWRSHDFFILDVAELYKWPSLELSGLKLLLQNVWFQALQKAPQIFYYFSLLSYWQKPRIKALSLSTFILSSLRAFKPSGLQAFRPSSLQAFKPWSLQAFGPSSLRAFKPWAFTPLGLRVFGPSSLWAWALALLLPGRSQRELFLSASSEILPFSSLTFPASPFFKCSFEGAVKKSLQINLKFSLISRKRSNKNVLIKMNLRPAVAVGPQFLVWQSVFLKYGPFPGLFLDLFIFFLFLGKLEIDNFHNGKWW